MMFSQQLIFLKSTPWSQNRLQNQRPSAFQQYCFVLRYTRYSIEQRYGSVVSDPRLDCLGCVSMEVV